MTMITNDCEIWTGGTESGKPGRQKYDGKRIYPHRKKWEDANGPIPQGKLLLRTCENDFCMNLEHMKLGTATDTLCGAESDWKITGQLKTKGLKKFWARIQRTGPDECWPWTGGKDKDGYGKLGLGTSCTRSNKVAWILANGPIAGNLCVLHTCDNPSCCNPAHLFLGTNADNMRDKTEKGRAVGAHKGSAHHFAKLNEEKVFEMRQLKKSGLTVAELGRRFGVSYMVAKMAIIGQKWKHVPMP